MMTPELMRRWEKRRAKGKDRFVLVYGFLIPVLCFSVFALLFLIFWPGNIFIPDPSRQETPVIVFLLGPFIAVVVIPYYRAQKEWDANEKEYQAACENEKKSGE